MKGPIAWFVKNPVAANLLMVVILVGGFLSVLGAKPEVFPEFSLDTITVSVPYLGAAPEEVEEGVNIRIEEAIQGIDGIEKITSTASEGSGSVSIELDTGADLARVLDEVKARVDAIETFPEETEKPLVQEVTNRRQVINVAIHGDVAERTLKVLAERTRDEIAAIPGITQVDVSNARAYEISIEISESQMRRHGLTFDQVAGAVRRSSLDLPGGSVKTVGGEFLLRTKGQAYSGEEFENLVLLTRPDGTHVQLGDIAQVVDGFAETDQFSRFQNDPALMVEVFRTEDQGAIEVATLVNEYVADAEGRLPAGVSMTTWNDSSLILQDRLSLLVRNGVTGFILVVIVLSLFLHFKLAFWVSLGIPISFLGALWMLPALDVTINMMSLFAFIVVLGIVVDDAIIVGENVYAHQQRHGDGLRAAVEGTREVAVPVIFAILTTVAAFAPMLMVEGVMGKIMAVIPLVVIPCLAFSLIESKLILPAHLAHTTYGDDGSRPGVVQRAHNRVGDGLQWFIQRVYRPSLAFALRWRYLTVATAAATVILTAGLVGGGWLRFVFMPPVESDTVSVSVTMPQGTPVDVTSAAVQQLETAADRVRAEVEEETGLDVFKFVYATIGSTPGGQGGPGGGGGTSPSSSNIGGVLIELSGAEERPLGSTELANRWRDAIGVIPDAVEVRFTSSLFSAGDPIYVQLTGTNIDELRGAAVTLKERLAGYAGVYDITDSFREGKQELKLGIQPAAEMLGLSLQDMARQVRQAFYGEEAQRIQRGRDDVRVMVRYPEAARRSLGNLESMRIRTPDGQEVPFSQVAVVEPGRGFASIRRVDRRREVSVTADVDSAQTTAGQVIADLETRVLPEVLVAHPGVLYSLEGEQAEQRESLGGLYGGFAIAMLVIYALLAVPLKSYIQPFVIMSAIPFGFVGATWGHVIMGLDLSLLSMFGLVALTGVVVNDSLVLVDFANRHRAKGGSTLEAVQQAGARRFRPILLTSLTTFFGLFPLIMETSRQAQFMIPMAVSLAFGVVFSTVVTLIIVPTLYLIAEDFTLAMARLWRGAGVPQIEPDVEKGSVAAPAFVPVSSASRVQSPISGAT
jgi:multidrug efflux pump subunit AcrB